MNTLYNEIKKHMYFNKELDSKIYELSMIILNLKKNPLIQPILINGSVGTGKTELIKIISSYHKASSMFITVEKGCSQEYYVDRIKEKILKEELHNPINIICLDNIHLISNFLNYMIKLMKYIKDNFNRDIVLIGTCNKDISINYSAYFYLLIINEYTIIEKINIVEKLKDKIADKIGCTFNLTPEANIDLNLFHRMSLGVASLERDITQIAEKKALYNNDKSKLIIDKCDIQQYFSNQEKNLYSVNDDLKVGITNSLTYNMEFNFQLKVEAKIVERSAFKSYIFGNLDKEAVDSINIASYCAINLLQQKGIELEKRKTVAISLYGVKLLKKGSSCGLAAFIACMSSILNIPICQNIGFSGEITLHGDIIGVGNIEQKIIQGYNRGIIEFYLPVQNTTEASMIPDIISKNIKINLVQNIDQIYQMFFSD